MIVVVFTLPHDRPHLARLAALVRWSMALDMKILNEVAAVFVLSAPVFSSSSAVPSSGPRFVTEPTMS